MLKTKIEIIYADDDILVINKPSGVSVTADRSGEPELVDILGKQLGPQIRSTLRLVHRLDKHTSGVMVLAKNTQAQSAFSSCFEKRLVTKTYLALARGIIPGREGTIDLPLARSNKKPGLMCVARKKGKEAITNWKLLADFGATALLAVHPLTGRTHQIRIHLPSIGLPLLIDHLYGNHRPFFLSDFKADYRLGKRQIEKPLIERLTLHAYQLELPPLCHSEQSEESHLSSHSEAKPKNLNHESQATSDESRNCFIAVLDKKFAAAIKMLTKHNPNGQTSFINQNDFTKIIRSEKLD